MDNIESVLGKLFKGRDFEKEYQNIKNEVLTYEPIRSFLEKNNEYITTQIINQNLSNLYEFMNQHQKWQQQEETLMPGYAPKLALEGDYITVIYAPTAKKLEADQRRAIERRIRSFYMPKQVVNATLEHFYTDEECRKIALVFAYEFIRDYIKNPSKLHKGLYIHGEFGTGKTFLLGAIARDFATKGITSTLVYLPEFMREIKQAIADNTVGEKIQFAKKTEILMLDDIGAEAMTSWTRDEVLGTILQYRMQEELPTFFSSNYSMEELEEHITFTQNQSEERLKARRIMERIRFLAKEIELNGKNRRKES